MSIFTAGIVWDRREPLPDEYRRREGRQVKYGNHIHPSLGDDIDGHGEIKALYENPLTDPKLFSLEDSTPKSRRDNPDLVVQEPTRNVLPPLSISLEAQIVQDTAKVTVSQIFWDNTDGVIEGGAYTFPLPNGCTVTDFNCRVGTSRILKAVAKPKEEA